MGLGGEAAGDCREGSDSSLAHLGWHARWLQRWVDLERQGLVGEVQEMGVSADAGVGMLGSFVVVQGRFGVGVVGHGWGGRGSNCEAFNHQGHEGTRRKRRRLKAFVILRGMDSSRSCVLYRETYPLLSEGEA